MDSPAERTHLVDVRTLFDTTPAIAMVKFQQRMNQAIRTAINEDGMSLNLIAQALAFQLHLAHVDMLEDTKRRTAEMQEESNRIIKS